MDIRIQASISGVPGGLLSVKSWVDLRYLDDFDELEFQRRLKSKRIVPVMSLTKGVAVELLDCAAGAEDTTRLQERAFATSLRNCGRQSLPRLPSMPGPEK
jgi:hypothetical protein